MQIFGRPLFATDFILWFPASLVFHSELRGEAQVQGTSILKSLLALDLQFTVKFSTVFDSVLCIFCKNQGAGGKFNVLTLCRINNMSSKIYFDPKSAVRKIGESCIDFTRRRVLHNLNTLSTSSYTTDEGEKNAVSELY